MSYTRDAHYEETSACVSLGKGFLLLAYSDFIKSPTSSFVAAMFAVARDLKDIT